MGDVAITEIRGREIAEVAAFPATSAQVAAGLTAALGIQPPDRPNTVVVEGTLRLISAAPQRWIWVDQSNAERSATGTLASRLPPDAATVTDLSAGRCIFGVEGPRAREALSRLLRIDLFPGSFPPGRCAQTTLAHVSVLVYALSEAAFEIITPRSYARHIWEVLSDAIV